MFLKIRGKILLGFVFVVNLMIFFAGCKTEKKNIVSPPKIDKEIIISDEAPDPVGPYSQAVKINGVLYVSGQIAIDPHTGELVDKNIEMETQRVMENLGAVLSEAGMNFHNVVKCSIFISDIGLYSRINKIYGTYFGENSPARETVEVARLPGNARIEISLIAVE